MRQRIIARDLKFSRLRSDRLPRFRENSMPGEQLGVVGERSTKFVLRSLRAPGCPRQVPKAAFSPAGLDSKVRTALGRALHC
jgi:hypothetical protein